MPLIHQAISRFRVFAPAAMGLALSGCLIFDITAARRAYGPTRQTDSSPNLTTSSAVATSGDVYLVFTSSATSGAIDLDPGPTSAPATCASPKTGKCVVVVKYASNGSYLWHFVLAPTRPSTTFGQHVGMDIDANDNLWIAAHLDQPVDIDPSSATLTVAPPGAGKNGLVVAKYNSAGQYQYHGHIAPSGPGNIYPEGLRVDRSCAEECIVIGGKMKTSTVTDFDPGEHTANVPSTEGRTYPFLTKLTYGPGGWRQGYSFSMSGTATAAQISDIVMDPMGNYYAVVTTQGPGNINAGGQLTFPYARDGMAVAKYNSAGSYQWGFAIDTSQR